MKPKIPVWRHGESLFVKIEKPPTSLKETKTKSIIKGSHGHPHTFDNGKIYFVENDTYIIGYFVAKNTTLFHEEHGKSGKAKLLDGIYEIRRSVEHTPEGLIPVLD